MGILVVERFRSDSVSVPIEVEQEEPIWLIVGGVSNCCHVEEHNRRRQWIGGGEGIVWLGACTFRCRFPWDRMLRCPNIVAMALGGGSTIIGLWALWLI